MSVCVCLWRYDVLPPTGLQLLLKMVKNGD